MLSTFKVLSYRLFSTQGSSGNRDRLRSPGGNIQYTSSFIVGSVISKNLKLGGYRQILGGGGGVTMRKAHIYNKKQKKTEKMTMSWGGVVSQMGGSLPP